MNSIPKSHIAAAQWTSFHCFIAPSQQSWFIARSLEPTAVERRGLPSFFFLRYWQGGPHVRVRFRQRLDDETQVSLQHAFAEQIDRLDTEETRKEYLQATAAQEYLADLEGESSEPSRAHGVVELAEYKPEEDKYGGVVGVSIAEELFLDTSRFVAERLKDSRLDERPVAEIYAVELMLHSLHGFGLSGPELHSFSKYYSNGWLRYTPEAYRNSWPMRIDRVRERLTDLTRSILGEKPQGFIPSVYARARFRLEEASSRQPEIHRRVDEPAKTSQEYWPLLYNYVHTTNNRLGLMPAQEAFVGYLLADLLSE